MNGTTSTDQPKNSTRLGLLNLSLVFLGGSLGVAARAGLILLLDTSFPWAVLLSNLLGAFLLGGLYEFFGAWAAPRARLFAGTGLLGGFTTYSALSLDLVHFLDTGQIAVALLYASLTMIGGLLVSAAGVALVTTSRKKTP